MPKQPASQAGSSTNRGKPVKIIQKTADLMQKGAKGKGKENAVFGELNNLVKGELVSGAETGRPLRIRNEKPACCSTG